MKTTSAYEDLLKIEDGFGLDKEREELSNYSLAILMGYQGWNKSLQKRFDELVAAGRVSVSKKAKASRGRGETFTLTLLKPLSGKEKRQMNDTDVSMVQTAINVSKELSAEELMEQHNKNIESVEDIKINKNLNPEDLRGYPSINIEDNINVSNINISSSVDDIDELFDDLKNITKNVLLKNKDILDENSRLKLELEISHVREQRWQIRAAEYRQMLCNRS